MKETTSSSADLARTRLEQAFTSLLSQPVALRLTNNRRTMASWRVRQGVLRLRLHQIFVDAPSEVLAALSDLVRHQRRAEANAIVDRFIELHRAEIRGKRAQRLAEVRGNVHDLQAILSSLNERLLRDEYQGLICWGRRSPHRRRRTIRLGSYDPSLRLIRINPTLDQTFVPRFFVEWIVYHEMLHQLVEMPRVGERYLRHSPHFREREALFPDYERAKQWETAHLRRLLST